jgi:hypothetical protein
MVTWLVHEIQKYFLNIDGQLFLVMNYFLTVEGNFLATNVATIVPFATGSYS